MGFDNRRQAKEWVPQEGDTLKSIAARESAEGNDVTWQEIAKFNWGTDDEVRIEELLSDELGWIERNDADELVYSSDAKPESDLLIPVRFERKGFPVEQTHVLRVRKAALPTKEIVLDDVFLGFVKDTDVELGYADGTTASTTSDENGVVSLERGHGKWVDVEYTSEAGEYKQRIFLFPAAAGTDDGAWQRLVNLGYVAQADPPESPDDPAALASAVQEFQADHGLDTTGEIDADFTDAITTAYDDRNSWAERGPDEQSLAALPDGVPKEMVT